MDTGWMLSALQALLGKGGWLSHKLFLHCPVSETLCGYGVQWS